jgi:hypothetical protein
MTRLKNATYETGSLTGTDGATSTSGTITLDTTSKVKGVNSAFVSAVTSFQRFDFTASDEIYVSFYLHITAHPSSMRNFYITNGLRMDIRSNGALRLQTAAGVTIGSDSPVLTVGQIYRVGMYWKKATVAANDGIGMGWVTATGAPDAAFGSPFATSTSLTQTGQLSRFDIGNTAGATANSFYHDNVRIDNVSMPLDDVTGGIDTPMAVNVTTSNTLVITKGVGMPRSLVSTVTPTITKLYTGLKTITQSVTSTLSIQRAIDYTKSVTVTSTITAPLARAMQVLLTVLATASASKTFAKIIELIAAVTVSSQRAIARTFSTVVTSTFTFAKGMVTLKDITLVVNTAASVLKNIGKPILQTVSTILTRNTDIPKRVLLSVTPILFLNKDWSFTKVINVAVNIVAIGGQLYFKTAEIIVNTSLVITKNILKPITVIQSVIVSLAPKNIGKAFTTVVTGIVNAVYGNLILKEITVGVSTVVNRVIGISKTINVVQGTIVTIQRSFTLLVNVFINAPIVLTVQKRIGLIRSVVIDSFVSFSKLLQNQYINTPFHKNVRALTLGIKNSTLDVLGKNSRAITLRDTNDDN